MKQRYCIAKGKPSDGEEKEKEREKKRKRYRCIYLTHAAALWSGTNKNRDVSTGPLARPFARSLAPLTHSLAPDCSLHSRPPLRSLVRSLAHFAHSLARGTVSDWMAILSVFFSIIDHSVVVIMNVKSICGDRKRRI